MQDNILSRSLIALAAVCVTSTVNATTVTVETSSGTFEINLYDLGTPETVANFMAYVNSGAYTESFIHRSDPGFVIQGGGFRTDMNGNPSDIPQNATVDNEPVYSNVRGTIAMAKLGGQANSATNQWFFNLSDNVGLDSASNSGGFTVFGEVVGNGMDVVDAIADIPVYNQGGVYAEIPLQNYTLNDPVTYANLIVVHKIELLDPTVDSAGAAGLNPALNTANNGGGGGGGGGGSFGLLALLGLSAIAGRRNRIAKAA